MGGDSEKRAVAFESDRGDGSKTKVYRLNRRSQTAESLTSGMDLGLLVRRPEEKDSSSKGRKKKSKKKQGGKAKGDGDDDNDEDADGEGGNKKLTPSVLSMFPRPAGSPEIGGGAGVFGSTGRMHANSPKRSPLSKIGSEVLLSSPGVLARVGGGAATGHDDDTKRHAGADNYNTADGGAPTTPRSGAPPPATPRARTNDAESNSARKREEEEEDLEVATAVGLRRWGTSTALLALQSEGSSASLADPHGSPREQAGPRGGTFADLVSGDRGTSDAKFNALRSQVGLTSLACCYAAAEDPEEGVMLVEPGEVVELLEDAGEGWWVARERRGVLPRVSSTIAARRARDRALRRTASFGDAEAASRSGSGAGSLTVKIPGREYDEGDDDDEEDMREGYVHECQITHVTGAEADGDELLGICLADFDPEGDEALCEVREGQLVRYVEEYADEEWIYGRLSGTSAYGYIPAVMVARVARTRAEWTELYNPEVEYWEEENSDGEWIPMMGPKGARESGTGVYALDRAEDMPGDEDEDGVNQEGVVVDDGGDTGGGDTGGGGTEVVTAVASDASAAQEKQGTATTQGEKEREPTAALVESEPPSETTHQAPPGATLARSKSDSVVRHGSGVRRTSSTTDKSSTASSDNALGVYVTADRPISAGSATRASSSSSAGSSRKAVRFVDQVDSGTGEDAGAPRTVARGSKRPQSASAAVSPERQGGGVTSTQQQHQQQQQQRDRPTSSPLVRSVESRPAERKYQSGSGSSGGGGGSTTIARSASLGASMNSSSQYSQQQQQQQLSRLRPSTSSATSAGGALGVPRSGRRLSVIGVMDSSRGGGARRGSSALQHMQEQNAIVARVRATVRIQAAVRGWLVRRMIAYGFARAELMVWAATRIQALWRGHVVRSMTAQEAASILLSQQRALQRIQIDRKRADAPMELQRRRVERDARRTQRRLANRSAIVGDVRLAKDLQRDLVHLLRAGDPDRVHAFLERDAENAMLKEQVLSCGWTPLHEAALLGGKANAELCKPLVAAGARVDARTHSGVTPLLLACSVRDPDVARALLDLGAPRDQADARGVTPLHIVCSVSGGVSLLDGTTVDDAGGTPGYMRGKENKQIAAQVAKVMASVIGEGSMGIGGDGHAGGDGQDGIGHGAANINDDDDAEAVEASRAKLRATGWAVEKIVDALLAPMWRPNDQGRLSKSKGADPSPKGPHGRTALHAAADAGLPKVVAKLLAHGADADVLDSDRRNALHLACLKGHHLCVEAIVRGRGGHEQLKINIRDITRRSPLHICAENGDLRCLEPLLTHPDLNLNIADEMGATPLLYAIWGGAPPRKTGDSPERENGTPAVTSVPAVRRLLEHSESLKDPSPSSGPGGWDSPHPLDRPDLFRLTALDHALGAGAESAMRALAAAGFRMGPKGVVQWRLALDEGEEDDHSDDGGGGYGAASAATAKPSNNWEISIRGETETEARRERNGAPPSPASRGESSSATVPGKVTRSTSSAKLHLLAGLKSHSTRVLATETGPGFGSLNAKARGALAPPRGKIAFIDPFATIEPAGDTRTGHGAKDGKKKVTAARRHSVDAGSVMAQGSSAGYTDPMEPSADDMDPKMRRDSSVSRGDRLQQQRQRPMTAAARDRVARASAVMRVEQWRASGGGPPVPSRLDPEVPIPRLPVPPPKSKKGRQNNPGQRPKPKRAASARPLRPSSASGGGNGMIWHPQITEAGIRAVVEGGPSATARGSGMAAAMAARGAAGGSNNTYASGTSPPCPHYPAGAGPAKKKSLCVRCLMENHLRQTEHDDDEQQVVGTRGDRKGGSTQRRKGKEAPLHDAAAQTNYLDCNKQIHTKADSRRRVQLWFED